MSAPGNTKSSSARVDVRLPGTTPRPKPEPRTAVTSPQTSLTLGGSTVALAEVFKAHGYKVERAGSVWILKAGISKPLEVSGSDLYGIALFLEWFNPKMT